MLLNQLATSRVKLTIPRMLAERPKVRNSSNIFGKETGFYGFSLMLTNSLYFKTVSRS